MTVWGELLRAHLKNRERAGREWLKNNFIADPEPVSEKDIEELRGSGPGPSEDCNCDPATFPLTNLERVGRERVDELVDELEQLVKEKQNGHPE